MKTAGVMSRNTYCLIQRRGLNPKDYLVLKDLNYTIVIQHKQTGAIKILERRNTGGRKKNGSVAQMDRAVVSQVRVLTEPMPAEVSQRIGLPPLENDISERRNDSRKDC